MMGEPDAPAATSGELVPSGLTGEFVKAVAKELTSARKGAAAMTDLSQGAGILDDSRRKARYGVAFLRAVCAQAGVPMQETSPDEDVFAVDCTADFAEGPVFVQVKCTSTLALAGASASVALEDKWKERWARRLNPVYLLLVLVPSDVEHGWSTRRRARSMPRRPTGFVLTVLKGRL